MRKLFIVDYAYGFHAETCEVDYVCRLRSLAAIRALKRFPEAHIVLSAGMKESTGDCGPLANMMENFLKEQGVPAARILPNPKGRDTFSETEAAFDMIQKQGGGKVVCATSAFHAPRVTLIWLFRFGILPSMYTTKLKAPLSETLKELRKIPRDIVRSVLRRIVTRNPTQKG